MRTATTPYIPRSLYSKGRLYVHLRPTRNAPQYGLAGKALSARPVPCAMSPAAAACGCLPRFARFIQSPFITDSDTVKVEPERMRPHFGHRAGFVKHPILSDIEMVAYPPESTCQMACQKLLFRKGDIGSRRAAMHHEILDTAGKILTHHHSKNRIKVANKKSRPTPKR